MSDPLERLVGELSRLPGIGPKTATRLAHHLLKVDRRDAEALAESVLEVKDKLFHCSVCNAITDEDPCRFCTDPRRDRSVICVVEQPFNIQPLERTGEYRGLFHVLLGALSPQRGIGPDQLAVDALLQRLEAAGNGDEGVASEPVQEVILATNPNVEGEATALYLARLLQNRPVTVSRLAFGMPVGGDIEYTDEVTLGRSLAGRRPLG